MEYYLIAYKYLSFAIYRLIYSLKTCGAYDESIFEMSAVNNFGIWNKLIIMESTDPPYVKTVKNGRKLFKTKWLKDEKFGEYQKITKTRNIIKFLERINIRDYIHKNSILSLMKYLREKGSVFLSFYLFLKETS